RDGWLPMVITIDGPAGAGKSTVARRVAERLGLLYVDTGALYRELTAVALARAVNLNNGEAPAAFVGEDAPRGAAVRTAGVSPDACVRRAGPFARNVGGVPRPPQVRARVPARQRELAVDAVLEGRDTGSVVCPGADLKVYLVASNRVRAERRAADLGLPVDEVEQSLTDRDDMDAGQLAPAPAAR